MADNSSSSPQIPQNPNPSGLSSPSPSVDLTSISSPQLPPLHPQNPSPSPNPNPNPNPNPSPMMASSASSPNFQNLQRSASGSMPRLTPLLQQQLGAAIAARQFAGGGGAQMSFGGQQQHGMGRIGQAAAGAAAAGQQISMLPGQSLAQFNNMQAQMLMQQPRQKASLVQAMQFNSGNTSGQGLQGMQAMGMMGSLGINQQLRPNGPLSYGQHFNGQIRQQQLSMQNPLTSPQKLPGQGLPRGSSRTAMNPQFSGLTQNGQSTSVNALTQQPWLKQMQQAISSPVSPSHSLQQQRQQQAFSPQQPSSSQLQHQKSLSLNQHQISQLVQQQVGSPRQHQSQQQQQQQQQITIQQLQLLQQLQQQQQQSPRMQGSGFQKSISLTGSQPGTPASVTTTTGGNSSQGAEASNQLLGKRKIQDLVSQVDPLGKLDPAVEDLLLEIADDFIDTVTTFACSLAKHRKSSTLEPKDLLLHLEKNMHLTVPGFTKEGQKYQKEPVLKDAHNKRLESIRASMESQLFEKDTSGRQAITDSALNCPLKPSPSSEQLVLSAAASQMLHKVPRF